MEGQASFQLYVVDTDNITQKRPQTKPAGVIYYMYTYICMYYSFSKRQMSVFPSIDSRLTLIISLMELGTFLPI